MFPRLKSIIAALTVTAAAGASIAPHVAFAQAAPAAPATTATATTGAAPAVQLAQADTSEPGLSAPTSQETVDNPYGLGALWAQGDFVAKGTLLILVIFSIGSWYILVTKLYESLKLSREAKDARKNFFKAANLQEGAGKLKEGSAFRFVAESGITASNHHEGELTEHIDRNTWITTSVQRSVDEVQARLQSGLAFLATVGSTAPFIGLFGTVWGIYHALTAIGIAGQASIDKVAGPVGEALIMTAIGLAVAVPAVLGYNWLVRRNKVTLDAVRGFGADLHGVLIGAKTAR
ncbi:MotA/TolQ/ExbB proton channel family protein [Aquabacterium soli]|uniref:Biopolymer transport protein ExbB n=1 Tax=Aquabacterium soli TaxID=2493092 RepID=A0A3R8YLI6_9BURK|nr:MotA/TolQ/ExbB proton channel family protein [Aquabacterium soli]RRS03171.1 MotA/TolQ/ExbB proton channel family protein [Aquabacterium soli]